MHYRQDPQETGSLIQKLHLTCAAFLQPLKQQTEVMLGDIHALKVIRRGAISLKMKLPNRVTQKCDVQDVLYVPALLYNLLLVSVSKKAAEKGKVTEFDNRWEVKLPRQLE